MTLLERLKNTDNIIIYGAGDYGQVVLEYLENLGVYTEKKIHIAVSKKEDKQQNTTDKIGGGGIPIREIDELRDYCNSSLVIVAVSKEKQRSMIEKLLNIGFENYFSMTEILYTYMKKINNKLKSIEEIKAFSEKQIAYSEEILWGMNFNRAIENSKWLRDKEIKVGDSACGYYYFYILYKALNSGKFKSILDIGMGQTSKLIGQYVIYNDAAKHTIIENDKDWIDFILPELKLGKNSEIIQLDYKMTKKDNIDVRVYEDFSEKVTGTYDLLSIDAPAGYDMTDYSRIDILSILPRCLKESFIIMIDDTDRAGERNTVNYILDALEKNKIQCVSCSYQGKKRFTIITSKDNKFFCTL